MKNLVCPHCQTHVPENANVCTGCGAEVVRGATRGERSMIGCAFMLLAIPALALILAALEIRRGSSPLPPVHSDGAFFVFVGLVGFFVVAFIVGQIVARLFFRRSQVRFFRTYRHQ